MGLENVQKVVVYGTGAKVPPQMHHSNCFPISLDPARVEVTGGMAQILKTYRRCTEKMKLSSVPKLEGVCTSMYYLRIRKY